MVPPVGRCSFAAEMPVPSLATFHLPTPHRYPPPPLQERITSKDALNHPYFDPIRNSAAGASA